MSLNVEGTQRVILCAFPHTGRSFNGIHAIQVLTSKNLNSGSGVNAVAFHPTKNILASCSSDSIKLWNSDTGTELRTVVGEKNILSLAFSLDGRFIATGEGCPYNGTEPGSVRIYCVSTDK